MPPTPAPQPADAARPASARIWLLAGTGALAQALVASACLLALHLFFEAGDRERLQAHLQEANLLLARVDDAAALSALPARLQHSFSDEPGLAVRVQGAHGQPLYEQGAHTAMPPALLARPRSAPPAPLVSWHEDGHAWRGSALVMRMPLAGAAPLTVAMALDVQRQHAFLVSLRTMLLGCVLLGWLALAAIAVWTTPLSRRRRLPS
ncbi:MAG: hypothetical protein Q4G71_04160 [Pseudomonadota bacterium]|nr:hypothetical protein [Pseudomonadota bacterium]